MVSDLVELTVQWRKQTKCKLTNEFTVTRYANCNKNLITQLKKSNGEPTYHSQERPLW